MRRPSRRRWPRSVTTSLMSWRLPIEITSGESKREALPSDGWAVVEDRLREAGADVYPWRTGDDLAALLSPDVSGDLLGVETFETNEETT